MKEDEKELCQTCYGFGTVPNLPFLFTCTCGHCAGTGFEPSDDIPEDDIPEDDIPEDELPSEADISALAKGVEKDCKLCKNLIPTILNGFFNGGK